ncbi:MAG: NAD-dependent epimerase/dehydratase family protein [Candidatus Bathyarchaeota archaeon]|nr:NAD-dependent epimerase/dehydratase family protein [Candidatus Bathyarchaeota archaeon]
MGKDAGFLLVTGGAGFIGSHITDRLVGDGWRVRVVDNFSSGRPENIKHLMGDPRVEVLDLDLKDAGMALEAVRGVGAVFHFAANPEVRVSTTNPDVHFNENVVATFNLLEAMRKCDVRDLVFASSSSVYGEPDSIPVGEDAPIRPVSVYGASKAACENLIHAYSRLYGFRAAALRYANVVGPRLRHGVVYDFIVKLLRNPRRLEILGDGTQTRSYIHIGDAVEATLTVWGGLCCGFEAFNVGSEDWVTVSEIADLVASAMGLDGVRYVYRPVLHGVGWPGDVKRIALSIDRLKGLGWRPRMNSREALLESVKCLIQELRV